MGASHDEPVRATSTTLAALAGLAAAGIGLGVS
jgi:hypothetical protein